MLPELLCVSVPNIDMLDVGLSGIPLIDFKLADSLDKRRQLIKAIVPGIKIGSFLLDQATNLSQKGPTRIIGQIGDCNRKQFYDIFGILSSLSGSLWGLLPLGFLALGGAASFSHRIFL